MDRIGAVRKCLSRWKKASDSNSKDIIKRLRDEFEAEVSLRFPNFQKMNSIKIELAKAYRDEEEYWKQKIQKTWLKVRDKNTKFFHESVKYRRMKKTIFRY